MFYGYGILNNHVPTLKATAMRSGAAVSSLLTSLYAVYKGESNANDSLGVYNGTAQGGLTYTAGKSGNAFDFNGTTAYVNIGDVMDVGTSSWSYSCWFNSNNLTGYRQIISKSYAAASNGRWWMQTYNNKIQFNFARELSSVIEVESTTTISTNTWYHLVCIIDRSDKLKVYINGNLETLISLSATNDLTPYTATNYDSIAPLRFGAYTASDSVTALPTFSGKIDAIHIWNRVLTQLEITALYNLGNGLQYPF